QYPFHGGVHFVISKSARGMLQGQADRQTFAFRINAFALINVKQSEVFQHWPSLVVDALQQVAGDNGLLHHHGDIPSDFWELREFREGRQTSLGDTGQAQLEEEDRAIEVQLVHQLRVRSEEHTSELQSRDKLSCRLRSCRLCPYTALFRSRVVDALQQVAGDNGLLHHHGDIPSDFWELREFREGRQTSLGDTGQAQLEEEDRAIEVQLVHQLRV